MMFAIQESECELSPSEQSILARKVLGTLLSEYSGIGTLPKISKDKNGKPFFPDFPEIHFSISHCKKAVMAVIDSEKVGCDIEMLQHGFPNYALEMAFSPQERDLIKNSAQPDKELTALWTRKEAYVKREGIIPDNPLFWRSDDVAILTRISHHSGYAFSIAKSSSY